MRGCQHNCLRTRWRAGAVLWILAWSLPVLACVNQAAFDARLQEGDALLRAGRVREALDRYHLAEQSGSSWLAGGVGSALRGPLYVRLGAASLVAGQNVQGREYFLKAASEGGCIDYPPALPSQFADLFLQQQFSTIEHELASAENWKGQHVYQADCLVQVTGRAFIRWVRSRRDPVRLETPKMENPHLPGAPAFVHLFDTIDRMNEIPESIRVSVAGAYVMHFVLGATKTRPRTVEIEGRLGTERCTSMSTTPGYSSLVIDNPSPLDVLVAVYPSGTEFPDALIVPAHSYGCLRSRVEEGGSGHEEEVAVFRWDKPVDRRVDPLSRLAVFHILRRPPNGKILYDVTGANAYEYREVKYGPPGG